MSKTYVKEMTHSGAETLSDQLSGTNVHTAGVNGDVWAGFSASDQGNTATLRGVDSGVEVIGNSSHPNKGAANNAYTFSKDDMVFYARCSPGEQLELTVVAAAASTSAVIVKTS